MRKVYSSDESKRDVYHIADRRDALWLTKQLKMPWAADYDPWDYYDDEIPPDDGPFSGTGQLQPGATVYAIVPHEGAKKLKKDAPAVPLLVVVTRENKLTTIDSHNREYSSAPWGLPSNIFKYIPWGSGKHVDWGGDTIYLDDKGNLHRDDGPAFEATYGGVSYYRHGVLHREDGPADVRPGDALFWSIDGKKHREDGPAIVHIERGKVVRQYFALNGQYIQDRNKYIEMTGWDGKDNFNYAPYLKGRSTGLNEQTINRMKILANII